MNIPTVSLSGAAVVGGLLFTLAVVLAMRNGWPPTLAVPDGGYLLGGETETENEKPSGLFRWVTSVDHKDIGIMYIVFATATALWGGTDAMMIRTELLTPGAGPWDPVTYNALFTTHGLTMLLFFVTPAFTGIGNYFLPLLLGADDMAYPRINAIAFWILPPAYLLVRAGLITEIIAKALAVIGFSITSLFALQPPGTGWTMYTPLTTQMVNPQIDLMLLGLHLSGIATLLAAINFIVTIFTERSDDVSWSKLDIFSWTMLTTSGLILFAFPLLGSALIMLLLDRNFGTTFFTVDGGGPLLWQHLFWFFGHPEVYILVLPAFGLVSLILPKFSGRKLFGFKFIVYSTLAIGVLSFGVWAHHMFTTGIDPRIRASFMAVSVAIAIPSAVKTFNWMTTMWEGHIRLTAPMLFCIGGIGTFIIGGVTGVFLAAIPIDLLYHDTYYVVGHFHFIVVGIITFAAFAASYYWYPLLTGRMYDQLLAKVHAWLSIVGTVIAFGLMLINGALGLPRRYATYPEQFASLQQMMTIGAFLIFAGVIIWLYNMIQSYRIGPVVMDADVWNLKSIDQFTREWQWFEERLEERRRKIRGE
ncbi:cbb3-type cytochrome c oxidase subunit I [Halocatena marina]|uniref:cbb3-type cytochrome c oxidase subunit I n=1 Tax=Halocatena marina TaxID=2934937 RepID=UPI002224E114|nr:cbb3-type cytochrome c oxidase subunit I [Halocatena marina]